MRNVMIYAAALGASMLAGSGAYACSPGAIADFLCKTGVINKKQANIADGIHAAAGNPMDLAARAAANYYVPGSTMFYDQVRGMNVPGPAVGQPSGGAWGPPQMMPAGWGAVPGMPQQAVGNRCWTHVAVSDQGPFLPVGTGCQIVVNGFVVQGTVR